MKTLLMIITILLSTQLVLADSRTIRQNIFKKFDSDPSFGSYEIELDTYQGAVTLTGKVASEESKQKAEQYAAMEPGVTQVRNNLQITEIYKTKIPGRELAHRVTERIALSPMLKSYSLDVSSSGDTVVLRGKVGSEHERRSAEHIAASTNGVTAVVNEITLVPGDSDDAISRRVLQALANNPEIDAKGIEVTTSAGVVTIRGHKDGHRQRDKILSVVLMVKGVKDIKNQLKGTY